MKSVVRLLLVFILFVGFSSTASAKVKSLESGKAMVSEGSAGQVFSPATLASSDKVELVAMKSEAGASPGLYLAAGTTTNTAGLLDKAGGGMKFQVLSNIKKIDAWDYKSVSIIASQKDARPLWLALGDSTLAPKAKPGPTAIFRKGSIGGAIMASARSAPMESGKIVQAGTESA